MIRVLLLNACGNGNFGDRYQTTAILHALYRIQFDGYIEIATMCDNDLHPEDLVIPVDQDTSKTDNKKQDKIKFYPLNRDDSVSQFDLVLIGGGGLLAHPHYPLHIDSWFDTLKTPIILHSVGASHSIFDIYPSYKRLRDHTIMASGRSQRDVEVLTKHVKKAQWSPDPILIDTRTSYGQHIFDHNEVTAAERGPRIGTQNYGVMSDKKYTILWIITNTMVNSLDTFRSLIREDDHVLGVEPAIDNLLITWNLPCPVVLSNDMDTVQRLISMSRNCVSMRYHGAIMSIKEHVPCLNYDVVKGGWLFEELDIEPPMIEKLPTDREELLRQIPVIDWGRLDRTLEQWRLSHDNTLKEALSLIHR